MDKAWGQGWSAGAGVTGSPVFRRTHYTWLAVLGRACGHNMDPHGLMPHASHGDCPRLHALTSPTPPL